MPTYKEQQILDKVCKVTRQKQVKYYDFIPFSFFNMIKLFSIVTPPPHFSTCSAVPGYTDNQSVSRIVEVRSMKEDLQCFLSNAYF